MKGKRKFRRFANPPIAHFKRGKIMDYKVFTPDMEYPEGMTDEQVLAIVKAFEMRRFAAEFEWQMECEEDAWVDDAKQLIEDGKVTASELVEEAFRMFWDRDIRDLHVCFSEAVIL